LPSEGKGQEFESLRARQFRHSRHPEAKVMAGVLRHNAPILSVASFRAWLKSRPDEQHWELIEGVPMMMTPPNRRHQRIASNLEDLLNAALSDHDPALAAYQNIGLNIVSTVPYDPEPDVAVVREDENSDPRYADRFYLVAEVLSDSDKDVIDSKRDIYRAHPSCLCILLVRQDRAEILVEQRTADGWHSRVLDASDQLALPEFGLACPVKDVYRNTPLG
jgi:Uma2 family endonuclease